MHKTNQILLRHETQYSWAKYQIIKFHYKTYVINLTNHITLTLMSWDPHSLSIFQYKNYIYFVSYFQLISRCKVLVQSCSFMWPVVSSLESYKIPSISGDIWAIPKMFKIVLNVFCPPSSGFFLHIVPILELIV